MECIEWWGSRWSNGYGRFRTYRSDGKRGATTAHRGIWEECFGPIPDGMRVLHKCDNPPCVNPFHLFLGSDADNVRDMIEKGRINVGSKNLWKRWGKKPPSDLEVERMKVMKADGKSERFIAREFGICNHTVKKLLGCTGP